MFVPFQIISIFLLIFGNSEASIKTDSVSVLHAPNTRLQVENAPKADYRFSDITNTLLLAFGYNPEVSTKFFGIEVVDPFAPLRCASILVLEGENLPAKTNSNYWRLFADTTPEELFEDLQPAIKGRSLKEAKFINKKIVVTNDEESLAQIDKIPELQSVGKDENLVMFVSAHLNATSDQLVDLVPKTESRIVKSSLNKCAPEETMVISVRMNHPVNSFIRKRRDIMAQPSSDLNLATIYSGDYPVIFNIILFLGIILTLFILGVSCAMANMDPGRDSIIYRMTNPRMKKDQ